MIVWLKRYVDNDTRYEPFICPTPAPCADHRGVPQHLPGLVPDTALSLGGLDRGARRRRVRARPGGGELQAGRRAGPPRLLKNRSGGEIFTVAGLLVEELHAEAEQADQLGAQRGQLLAADRVRAASRVRPTATAPTALPADAGIRKNGGPYASDGWLSWATRRRCARPSCSVQVLGHRSGERMDERPQVRVPVVGGDLDDQRRAP